MFDKEKLSEEQKQLFQEFLNSFPVYLYEDSAAFQVFIKDDNEIIAIPVTEIRKLSEFFDEE